MNDHANSGMLTADTRNLLGSKSLMNGAIALPQNYARIDDRFCRVAAQFLVGIPNDHFIQRNAHPVPGIASKMFVGEKQYFFAALKSPLHHRRGVRTCADRAAVLARK